MNNVSLENGDKAATFQSLQNSITTFVNSTDANSFSHILQRKTIRLSTEMRNMKTIAN